MATFPPIVVDNIPELQNAVWHVGVDPAPPETVPGWDTTSPNPAAWTFSNGDFTAVATS